MHLQETTVAASGCLAAKAISRQHAATHRRRYRGPVALAGRQDPAITLGHCGSGRTDLYLATGRRDTCLFALLTLVNDYLIRC